MSINSIQVAYSSRSYVHVFTADNVAPADFRIKTNFISQKEPPKDNSDLTARNKPDQIRNDFLHHNFFLQAYASKLSYNNIYTTMYAANVVVLITPTININPIYTVQATSDIINI